MTKLEFKAQIPKMDKFQLIEIGFKYIPNIKKSLPILLWIPKHLYNSIPKGFEVVLHTGKIAKFNSEIHKNCFDIKKECLPYGVFRKNIQKPKHAS